MKTKEFAILDINTLQLDVGAIQKHYEEKGFYLALVNYSIKSKLLKALKNYAQNQINQPKQHYLILVTNSQSN